MTRSLRVQYPSFDEGQYLVLGAVLRHQIVLNFQAEAEGVGADHLVGLALKAVSAR